ncbi:MAG: hypothetical protein NVS4B3_00280 [Gemmatimonadaceae bacterium]
MRQAVLAAALGGLAMTAPLSAQDVRPRAPKRHASGRTTVIANGAVASTTTGVRSEFAAVLLNAGRYDEAVREYRALVAADERNMVYRLGLARALAWGGHGREAEHEIRNILARRPADAAVTSLLVTARASFEPRAREAAEWLAERPGYLPYRTALARALVRDGQPRKAIAEYDTVLALGGGSAMLREQAEAYAAAGDRREGIRVLRDAVIRSPGDSTVRHGLASLLAADRQFIAALAEYDTLLAAGRTAPLLYERAQVDVARGDFTTAVADLHASLAVRPTIEAYFLLGDLARWRGDWAPARAAYMRAGSLNPRNPHLATHLADLEREERPLVAFVPPSSADRGWQGVGETVGDNLGMRYSTVRVVRGVEVGPTTVVNVGGEYRDLSEHGATGTVDFPGYAVSGGISREMSDGAIAVRVGGHGGFVQHTGVAAMPNGALAIAALYSAWGAGVTVATGPGYPSLLSAAALRGRDGEGPLSAASIGGMLGGPVGPADVAVSGDRTIFSDRNSRTSTQAYLRLPIGPSLAAVYAGTGIWFSERSTRYWDPLAYVAHAVGAEYASHHVRGWSYVVRLLPGIARESDASYFIDSAATASGLSPGRVLTGISTRTALQLTAGGEMNYRVAAWEIAGSLAYGRGRTGDYDRVGGSLQIRLAP